MLVLFFYSNKNSNNHCHHNRVNCGYEMEFKELIKTFNKADISIIKSVLEAEEIKYYLQGEYFNLWFPMIEPMRFMVWESQLEKTKELIKELIISYITISCTIS